MKHTHTKRKLAHLLKTNRFTMHHGHTDRQTDKGLETLSSCFFKRQKPVSDNRIQVVFIQNFQSFEIICLKHLLDIRISLANTIWWWSCILCKTTNFEFINLILWIWKIIDICCGTLVLSNTLSFSQSLHYITGNTIMPSLFFIHLRMHLCFYFLYDIVFV